MNVRSSKSKGVCKLWSSRRSDSHGESASARLGPRYLIVLGMEDRAGGIGGGARRRAAGAADFNVHLGGRRVLSVAHLVLERIGSFERLVGLVDEGAVLR